MKQLQILNIPNLYILRTTIEVHKHIYPTKQQQNAPEHDHRYILITQIHRHQTRQVTQEQYFIPNEYAKKYTKKQTKTHTTEHLNTKYVEIWNRLPIELRETKNKTAFKTETKKHLQQLQDKHNK
jgi:hypothetical protein